MLLSGHRAPIIKEFHSARNTLDRISKDTMFQTLNGLQSIVSAISKLMNIFSVDVLDPETSIFSQVEEGIRLILEVAEHDLENTLFGNLSEWRRSYNKELKQSRQAMHNMVSDSKTSLHYLKEVLLWQYGNEESPVLDLHRKYQSALDLFQEVAADMRRLVTSLYDFNMYFQSVSQALPSLFPAVEEGLLPEDLVYDRQDLTKCNDYRFELSVVAGNINGDLQWLIDRRLVPLLTSYKVNGTVLPPLSETIQVDIANRIRSEIDIFSRVTDNLHHCLSEYEDLLATISRFKERVHVADYHYTSIESSSIKLDALDDHMDWFQELYNKYATGTISKFYLMDRFSSHEKAQAILEVEKLSEQVRQLLAIPLESVMAEIEGDLNINYLIGLSHIQRLATYFRHKSSVILHAAWDMEILRRPHASMDNPEIIDFQLSSEEVERAGNMYINSFMETEAAGDISAYLDTYFEDLEEAIDEVYVSLSSASSLVYETIDSMDKILADFASRTQVDGSFIK